MPLDPSVSLGVKPYQPAAGINPIEMIGQWAQVQNAMNQNRLFQQTFAARQRAGQILSAAPDMETGLQSLLSDPLTAPFAAETINAVRQGQLTMTQMQGEIQTQSKSGMEAFFKTIPGLLADPSESTWTNLAESNLATLSPEARKRNAPAIDSLKKYILADLPADPEAARNLINQRVTAIALPNGLTPEGIKQIFGGNERVDVGGGFQPTRRIPEQLGGGEVPVGPSFPKTPAPSIQDVQGVPVAVGGGVAPMAPGMGQMGPGGWPQRRMPNELMPGVESSPIAPPAGAQANPLSPVPANASPAAPSPSPVRQVAPQEEELAIDGKPLYEGIERTPSVGTSNVIPGMRILSPAQQTSAQEQMKNFQGDDAKRYDSMVSAIGQLDRMNADMEEIAKRGGAFLQTGTFGGQRLEIAKSLNQMAQGLGMEPFFDPVAIAASEDFRKEATRAGMALLNQTLGAQREAASVIFSTIQAVPGLDNTLLGNQLVSKSLRAASQRVLDQRKFQERWAAQNQGDLTGSQIVFDRLHPGKGYLDQALKSMGLDEGGFESPIEIQRAFRNGYLTKDEAAGFLTQQFPDLFKSK